MGRWLVDRWRVCSNLPGRAGSYLCLVSFHATGAKELDLSLASATSARCALVSPRIPARCMQCLVLVSSLAGQDEDEHHVKRLSTGFPVKVLHLPIAELPRHGRASAPAASGSGHDAADPVEVRAVHWDRLQHTQQ